MPFFAVVTHHNSTETVDQLLHCLHPLFSSLTDMAKKDKTGGKKRDVQAEAAALEKPLKKAKQEKKAEEPAAASEEESEELEIPEDFEEGSEEGSDSEVRRCLEAG